MKCGITPKITVLALLALTKNHMNFLFGILPTNHTTCHSPRLFKTKLLNPTVKPDQMPVLRGAVRMSFTKAAMSAIINTGIIV